MLLPLKLLHLPRLKKPVEPPRLPLPLELLLLQRLVATNQLQQASPKLLQRQLVNFLLPLPRLVDLVTRLLLLLIRIDERKYQPSIEFL